MDGAEKKLSLREREGAGRELGGSWEGAGRELGGSWEGSRELDGVGRSWRVGGSWVFVMCCHGHDMLPTVKLGCIAAALVLSAYALCVHFRSARLTAFVL